MSDMSTRSARLAARAVYEVPRHFEAHEMEGKKTYYTYWAVADPYKLEKDEGIHKSWVEPSDCKETCAGRTNWPHGGAL